MSFENTGGDWTCTNYTTRCTRGYYTGSDYRDVSLWFYTDTTVYAQILSSQTKNLSRPLYTNYRYNSTYDAWNLDGETYGTDISEGFTLPAGPKYIGGICKWDTNPNGPGTYNEGDTYTTFDYNTFFYPIRIPVIYTVTWDYNGGSGTPATSTITYNSSLSIPTPTKTGYTFTGWSDGTKTYTSNFVYIYTSDKTFTAQWSLNSYTATWNYNGGSGTPATTSINYNATLSIPTTPTRTGYTFTGWSDGTTTYTSNFTYNYTSNKTFTAQWSINSYTLTLNSNGTGTGKIITSNYNANISIPTLKAIGYTFNGFYNNSYGSNLVVLGGNTYIMPESNNTLYAKWTDNTIVKFSDLQNTYGGSYPITISEYQASISKASMSLTSLIIDFKGKGPAPP